MKEDFQNIDEQLKTRMKDKISANLTKNESSQVTLLLAPNDLGVCRNGGRRGASFGPIAIANIFKSMSNTNIRKSISSHRVCDNFSNSFTNLQSEETKQIVPFIESAYNVIHLGGGHDHVYPFLKAINTKHKNILCINLDAHLDTRTDQNFHSGTPFRQFANEVEGQFHLVQLGIHVYANAPSNYIELSNNSQMEIFGVDEVESWQESQLVSKKLNEIVKKFKDYQIVLSLDCDAIDGSQMEAVSAVNHNGLTTKTVNSIFSWYRENSNTHYTGIYEYNPIYDNLSQKGSRYLASLIHRLI